MTIDLSYVELKVVINALRRSIVRQEDQQTLFDVVTKLEKTLNSNYQQANGPKV